MIYHRKKHDRRFDIIFSIVKLAVLYENKQSFSKKKSIKTNWTIKQKKSSRYHQQMLLKIILLFQIALNMSALIIDEPFKLFS